jgi:hypothetical protein
LAIVVAEDMARKTMKTLNARIKSGNFSNSFSRHYSSINKLPYIQINVTGNFTQEPWTVEEGYRRE